MRKNPFSWLILFLPFAFLTVYQFGTVSGKPRPMSEALQKAIERTKQFQSTDRDRRIKPTLTQTAIKQRQLQPVRLQRLDVQKLNLLLKTLDKTWIIPKLGVYEPVGTNFQYKKTCASIYKARPNACDQLGFGIMCFNFCYEHGEVLEFKCEDASDPQFCNSHSNYDHFLGKYRKDTYRTKAYIHQQLTRCYMSAVCNGALLNSSLMRSPANFAELPLHLRALRNRPAVNISAAYLENIFQDKGRRRTTSSVTSSNNKLGIRQSPVDVAIKEVDEEEKEVPIETPKKYVPFWQRLLIRKKEMESTPPPIPPELTIEEDAEEERQWLERRFGKRRMAASTEVPTKDIRIKVPASKITNRSKGKGVELVDMDDEESVNPPPRLMGTLSMEPIGFWNKFQPGKWFQSVHYITNTG